MKSIFKTFRSALITGVLIVLPAWLAILLFVKVLIQLGVIVRPISGHLPDEVNHPKLIGLVVFLLVCILTGVLVHTAIGKMIGGLFEKRVLSLLPGYKSLRSIIRQAGNLENEESFIPALIEVEDGALAPAFLIETHDGDLSTVFVPSVPTPMAGAIFIIQSSRVHVVDVPVATMISCISKWGTGSGKILKALKKPVDLSGDTPG